MHAMYTSLSSSVCSESSVLYIACALRCDMSSVCVAVYADISATAALFFVLLFADSNTDDKEDVFSRRVDDEVEKVNSSLQKL
jgi:hypothetical protein